MHQNKQKRPCNEGRFIRLYDRGLVDLRRRNLRFDLLGLIRHV